MKQPQLSKEVFGRGIQLINAIVTSPIVENVKLDAYYLLLSDLQPEPYLKAIQSLMRTRKYISTPPSPAEIIEEHNRIASRSPEIQKIIDAIERDLIVYGPENPPRYKKEIRKAIEALGGWPHLYDQRDRDEWKKNIAAFFSGTWTGATSHKVEHKQKSISR